MISITENIVFTCLLHLVHSDGYPKETPAQPFNSGSISGHGGSQTHGGYDGTLSTDYESRYHGPVAMLMVLPDGTIAETPEVAAARATHLAALNKAKALWSGNKNSGSYLPPPSGGSVNQQAGSYLPPAKEVPTNNQAGAYLPPAKEVPTNNQAGAYLPPAKEAPTNNKAGAYLPPAKEVPTRNQAGAYLPPAKEVPTNNQASSYLAPSNEGSTSNQARSMQGYDHSPVQTSHTKPYTGALASPSVLPSGYLADTPDVTAVRNAHLHALQKAQKDAAAWMPKEKKKWQ